MPGDVNEHEVVESKPKKKRRLKKFLKISGISFSLLFFAALVCYLVCLFIVAGDIRDNICAWRDDPDNPLNHRINAVPIEYKVDPEIAKDLEKFYIGEFEILLPKDSMQNGLLMNYADVLDSNKPKCYVCASYANFYLMCAPMMEIELGYHEAIRTKKYLAPSNKIATKFYGKFWGLKMAYEITTRYCDEPLAATIEDIVRICSFVPKDIEDCGNPWSVYKLEARLLIKNMLLINDGRIFRIKSANWDGCFVDTEYSHLAYLDIDDKMYLVSYGNNSFEDLDSHGNKIIWLSDEVKQTILASLKIHDEPDAGAIMYAKAREILDRQNIKLQEKLLGRLYALCAVSQEPENPEYAQIYLSTFRYPSGQAKDAYDTMADLFPDNKEMRKKAEYLDDWYWENCDYFEYEGDDPEVEYPAVNKEAQAVRVPFSEWKELTPEEKKEKIEAAREKKLRREKKRKKYAESAE